MKPGALRGKHDAIVRRRRDGETLQAIADSYGVCRQTIHVICKQHGVSTPVSGAQVRRLLRAVVIAARLSAQDARHDAYRYKRGCRCNACINANTEYIRSLRLRPTPSHGSVSGYSNYGCRCDQCREAYSAARKKAVAAVNNAWAKVEGALSNGSLVRQPCEVCGSESNVHAHHDDYNRPLDVRWLCARHHARLHRGEKAAA